MYSSLHQNQSLTETIVFLICWGYRVIVCSEYIRPYHYNSQWPVFIKLCGPVSVHCALHILTMSEQQGYQGRCGYDPRIKMKNRGTERLGNRPKDTQPAGKVRTYECILGLQTLIQRATAATGVCCSPPGSFNHLTWSCDHHAFCLSYQPINT